MLELCDFSQKSQSYMGDRTRFLLFANAVALDDLVFDNTVSPFANWRHILGIQPRLAIATLLSLRGIAIASLIRTGRDAMGKVHCIPPRPNHCDYSHTRGTEEEPDPGFYI